MTKPLKTINKKQYTNIDKLKIILKNPALWIETFVTIVDKNGKKVPFKLNPQQEQLINGLDKQNIVLKSRQLGITSVSCALSLFFAITQQDSNCMLVSYSMDSATQIFNKLKQMYDDLPNIMKPNELANNRSQLRFENGSTISVCTMGNKELGRGATLRFLHISEVAFCKQDSLADQLVALEQCMQNDSITIYESTANGINTFSEIWDKAESGQNMYKPFFFGWCSDYKMFVSQQKDAVKRYKNLHRHELTKEELTEDELNYMKLGATLEMIMWSRLKIANIGIDKFKQEYPSTPLEAFITSGNNVFKTDLVHKLYKNTDNFKAISNMSIIPDGLKPYKNFIKIWNIPVIGEKYYIGVDCSDGVGEDFHVVEVFDKNLEQCAEFRCNTLQPYVIGDVVFQIANYYNYGLCVIEKASGGNVVLDKLVHTYKYRNLYKHIEFDNRGKQLRKVGWVTSAKSKPILIQDFVELFENNDILIKSKDALKDMETYLYDGNSANAERGSHDDAVMAIGLSIEAYKSKIYYK